MQLMFPNGEHASVAFDNGEISIGSRAGQSVSLSGKSLAPHHASLVSDRRGLWLRVPAGVQGVHLNARPIRRIALLRIGDQVCLEQVQLVLAEHVEQAESGRSNHAGARLRDHPVERSQFTKAAGRDASRSRHRLKSGIGAVRG